VEKWVCRATIHMTMAPAKCRSASSFSVSKNRSATMPTKKGETMAAIAVAP
jgi:hypothetical protein